MNIQGVPLIFFFFTAVKLSRFCHHQLRASALSSRMRQGSLSLVNCPRIKVYPRITPPPVTFPFQSDCHAQQSGLFPVDHTFAFSFRTHATPLRGVAWLFYIFSITITFCCVHHAPQPSSTIDTTHLRADASFLDLLYRRKVNKMHLESPANFANKVEMMILFRLNNLNKPS